MAITSKLEAVKAAAALDDGKDPEAHARLLECVRQLTIEVETPMEAALRLLNQPQQNAALRLATEMNLLQEISIKDGETVSAQELAESCKADTRLIVRTMRILTAIGVADEAGLDQYKSNALIAQLASSGFRAGINHFYDLVVPVYLNAVEYFKQNGFNNPDDHSRSLCAHTFGLPWFEYLKTQPVHRAQFDEWMAGRRAGKACWVDVYPAKAMVADGVKDESEGVLLIDIGGNQGHDLSLLKETCPDLPGRLVLQDLPETLSKILNPPAWLGIMPHDFFTPQPVKGARAYFLRAIIHDWPDHSVVQILRQLIPAMERGFSRLLISDFVLPDTGVGLLPACLDFMMMTLVAGMERTERQWRELLDTAGFKIVKIWQLRPGTEAVIEAVLK